METSVNCKNIAYWPFPVYQVHLPTVFILLLFYHSCVVWLVGQRLSSFFFLSTFFKAVSIHHCSIVPYYQVETPSSRWLLWILQICHSDLGYPALLFCGFIHMWLLKSSHACWNLSNDTLLITLAIILWERLRSFFKVWCCFISSGFCTNPFLKRICLFVCPPEHIRLGCFHGF